MLLICLNRASLGQPVTNLLIALCVSNWLTTQHCPHGAFSNLITACAFHEPPRYLTPQQPPAKPVVPLCHFDGAARRQENESCVKWNDTRAGPSADISIGECRERPLRSDLIHSSPETCSDVQVVSNLSYNPFTRDTLLPALPFLKTTLARQPCWIGLS